MSRGKELTVKEADGGFILETYDPAKGYDDQGKAKVVTGTAAASKALDELFGKDGKKRTTLPFVELDMGKEG